MTVDSNYFSITEVVPGSVPAYLSGLSAYNVLSLGSVQDYASIEAAVLGETTWTDTISGLTANGHIRAITNAWCGAAQDPSGHRLLLHGGGHGDGAFNGIVSCDFSGDVAVGFGVVAGSWSAPGIVSNTNTSATYSDGRPASIHSYQSLVYNSALGLFFRTSCPIWKSGSTIRESFEFGQLTSTSTANRWVQRPDWVGSYGIHPMLVMNESAQKAVFVNATGGNQVQAVFYDFSTRTWSASSSTSFAFASNTDSVCVWDENRNQILVFDTSQGPVCRLHSIDWVNETFTFASLSLSGSVDGDGAMLYDPTRQSIWELGASTSQIRELTTSDGATYTVSTQSLSASYASSVGAGLFSRAVLMDDYRAIGVVGWYDEPARVIKLP